MPRREATNERFAIDSEAFGLRQSSGAFDATGLEGTNVTFALTNSLAGVFSVEATTNLLDWLFLGPAPRNH